MDPSIFLVILINNENTISGNYLTSDGKSVNFHNRLSENNRKV